MSDNNRSVGNSVHKAMDAVVSSWEATLDKIRQYKQEYQAQLEGLAAVPTTSAQALDVLRRFYGRVKDLRNTLNQPVPGGALLHVEAVSAIAGSSSASASASGSSFAASASAASASASASVAAATPAPGMRLAKVVLPWTRVAGPSVSAGTEVEGESASDSENVGKKNKGIRSSSKSGVGSIASKKDVKGKGRAKSLSPLPLPYSPRTIQKITRTVSHQGRKTSRLPLLKPIGAPKLGGMAATSSRAVSAPSRCEKRAATPEFAALEEESSEESGLGYSFVKKLPSKKRLLLIKPAAVLTGSLASGAVSPSVQAVAGPSCPEQPPSVPEPAKSDSEEETEFFSVLEFPKIHWELSATPDASSTPGPALAAHASATFPVTPANAAHSPTTNVKKEEPIASIEKGKGEVEVIDDEDTFIMTGASSMKNVVASGSGTGIGSNNAPEEPQNVDVLAIWDGDVEDADGKGTDKTSERVGNTPTKTGATTASGSGSASVSGTNIATSNNIPEDPDNINILVIWESDIAEADRKDKDKASEKVSGATTKATTTASGSGSIPSKKDVKGKGKAVSRSPSPGLSPKNNGNRVAKNKKDNKENKPLSRHSPSPAATRLFEHALNDKLNKNTNNGTTQEETVVKKLDKGKGKAIDAPAPAPATTENINGDAEVICITTTTTATTITAETSNSTITNAKNKLSNIAGTSTGSTSGPDAILSKKDPKGKGKATAGPFRPRSPSPIAGLSSPKAKSNTGATSSTTTKATKVTKRVAFRAERQTIKRSLAKKGQHWAFKPEPTFARCTKDIKTNKNKYFILCCPAPSCPSPNFDGKHPFHEGRAIAHFSRSRRDESSSVDADETTATDVFAENKNPCLMEIDSEDYLDYLDEDGDVEMTEAEIFERFGFEVVQEQQRWKVDETWARKNNRELCMKVEADEERENVLRELEESV